MRRRLAAAVALICGFLATPANAEEVCIAVLMRDAKPADIETIPYLSSGVRLSDPGDGLVATQVFGVGADVTGHLGTIGSRGQYGGAYEFRFGTWGYGESSLDVRPLAEGGMMLSFGQVSHAQWGTYAVRLGGGMSSTDDAFYEPHFTATITGGVHFLGERYTHRGACSPAAPTQTHGFGSALRLFATARSSFRDQATPQFTFGIEVSPAMLLPPYSLQRLGGAPL